MRSYPSASAIYTYTRSTRSLEKLVEKLRDLNDYTFMKPYVENLNILAIVMHPSRSESMP